jgi:hypothetical protein
LGYSEGGTNQRFGDNNWSSGFGRASANQEEGSFLNANRI